MRTAVVYESMFGNTHRVAEAIAKGLGEHTEVILLPVAEATAEALADADALVVGGPTHAHGLAGGRSHAAAAEQAGKHLLQLDEGAAGEGLRAWLDAGPNGGARLAAAFDTRARGPKVLTGSAAKVIARRLSRHGCALIALPESFTVESTEGPLADGELERAHAWGAGLGEAIATRREEP